MFDHPSSPGRVEFPARLRGPALMLLLALGLELLRLLAPELPTVPLAVLTGLSVSGYCQRHDIQLPLRLPILIGFAGIGLQLDLGQLLDLHELGAALGRQCLFWGLGLLLLVLLARLRFLPGNSLALLGLGIGGGGITALLAVAGQGRRSRPQELAFASSMVLLSGSVLMLLLPGCGRLLGFDDLRYGHWLGLGLANSAEALALAGERSGLAQQAAAVQKLVGNLGQALPVGLYLLLMEAPSERRRSWRPPVPAFVWVMLAAACLAPTLAQGVGTALPAAELSRAGFVTALLSLGSRMSLRHCVQAGPGQLLRGGLLILAFPLLAACV